MSDLLQLEDGSGILLHENADRMLLEDGIPFRPFIGAEPFTVTLTGAPIGVLVGRAVVASPFGIQIGLIDLDLYRDYELAMEAFQLTLGFAPTTAYLNRVVEAKPFEVRLGWSDVAMLRTAVVGAEPFTVAFNVVPLDFIRGYIFYLDGFSLLLQWADLDVLRDAYVEGEPFGLQLTFDSELVLERRRSEVGWDTALQPSICGPNTPLSPLIHAANPVNTGETAGGNLAIDPLHPKVLGEPKQLSNATHPPSKAAKTIPLEPCK